MKLTLDQALQKGIEAHKAGKVQEADRYYTAILKANPKHPDANHNMGILAVGVGKVEAALPLFETALEANSTIVQFWLSYIDAFIKLDRIAEAKSVLDQAKSKGVEEDAFEKLKERLETTSVTSLNIQDPPSDQQQALINLYTQGQYQQALGHALQLLKQFSNSTNLYNIIGAANHSLGKLDEAIQAYNKAISLKPDYAEAYNNTGNALKDLGKQDEAIQAYNKAISLKPDFAEAYNNMGNALTKQGKLEEAIETYNKALAIKPDYANAYFNMGNVLHARDCLDQAINAFQKAISFKPSYAEAHNNMGIVLYDQAKPDEAIDAYNRALCIKPDYAEAYTNMGNALRGRSFKTPNIDLQKTIVSLLSGEIYTRPSNIAMAAISLLKLEPPLQKHLEVVDSDLRESPLEVISDLSELPLLQKLMGVCPIPDPEIEGLLKNVRYAMLINLLSLKEASPELLEFQTALALQCFTNEYIYDSTGEEKKALNALEKTVQNTFRNKGQPSPQVVLSLASYKALREYEWYNLLVVTDDIQEVFTRQVEEPNEEEKLKQDLPMLEEITDSISSKVRAQYEDNPYPRWVNLGLPLKPTLISNLVDKNKLKLHDNKITEVDKPEILVAGCGTGQHSIGTAAKFKGSKVLAIDLSLSSLAYARRKTEELAVGNIEYMQADILNLGQLNKQFDIIESAGVLHHMENPMAGWKVLMGCLKPGGLMKTGLYSELARQHIVQMRQDISKAGIESSSAGMKLFRKMVMKSDQNHHKRILNSEDFYSMSTFRDLLFHVQEHRFTIPKIQNCLSELGLKFCGFESNEIVSDFQQTNTGGNDPYDLDKWEAYEQVNPMVFGRMYQFWCQKVD